jgi:hypothetical protein
VIAAPTEPITAEQRARFDRDGYLIIRGTLGPDEVTAARDALDRVYADAAKVGSLGLDGSMHLLGAVTNCPEIAGLRTSAETTHGPRPGHHSAVRLAGGARLPHPGASAAETLTIR